MRSCMTFLLRYNDYVVAVVSMELFILNYLSKPLDTVEWRSD